MSDENMVSISVYMKRDILGEALQIALLYDRSLSWLFASAWAIARAQLWEEAVAFSKTKVNSHPLGTLASVVLSAWGALEATPMPDSLWLLCVAVGIALFAAVVRWSDLGTTPLSALDLPVARYLVDAKGRLYEPATGAIVEREVAALDLLREAPMGISTLAGELHLTTKQAYALLRRLEANGLVRMSSKRVVRVRRGR